LFLVVALGGANAFGMTFDFRTPDQFNTIKVSINTSFGNGQLKGEIRGAGGTMEFPMERLETARGRVSIDARGIRLFHGKSQAVVNSSTWLDTGRFPRITFAFKGIQNLRWGRKEIRGDIVGTLTLKGKAKEMLLPAVFRYQRAGRRSLDGRAGDLLEVQATLSILRGEFGINPGGMLDQVKNEVSVTVKLLACSDKVRPLLPSSLFVTP
jgi:polyisoprenoid-binding protein YceI|tara:strand:+ start:244 stop:873 length:630 start_codon:yes stop_codon:yes gene_type:complete